MYDALPRMKRLERGLKRCQGAALALLIVVAYVIAGAV